jgi:hypothetical protein
MLSSNAPVTSHADDNGKDSSGGCCLTEVQLEKCMLDSMVGTSYMVATF